MPDPENQPAPPPSRRRRLVRRGFRFIGIAAVVTVTGYVAMHLAVRTAVNYAARKMGLNNLSYSLRTVTPTRVILGDLALGPTGPRLAQAAVEFSLWELLSARVRSVRVSGLEGTLKLSDGSIIIEGLTLPTTPSSGITTPSRPISLPLDSLPDRVDLSASVVRVILPDGTNLALPVSLNYTRQGKRADLSGSVQLGRDRLDLLGSAAEGSNLQARLSGLISTSTALPFLPPGYLPEGFTATGQANVELSGLLNLSDLASSTASFRLDLDNATARVPTPLETLDLTRINLESSGSISRNQFTATANLGATVKALYLDGPTQVLLKTTLTHSASLGTQSLGTLHVNGPALTAEVTRFGITRSSSGQVTAGAEFNTTVLPPRPLLERLRDASLLAEGIAPATFSGNLTLLDPHTLILQLNDLSAYVRRVASAGGIAAEDIRLAFTQASISLDLTSLTLDSTLSNLTATTSHLTGLPETRLSRTPDFIQLTLPSLSARFSSEAGYLVSTPLATLNLPPTSVSTSDFEISNAAGLIRVSCHFSPEEFVATLLDDSHLYAAGASDRDKNWTAGPVDLALTTRIRPTTQPTTSPAGAAPTSSATSPATIPSSHPVSTRPSGPVPFLRYTPETGLYAALRAEAKDVTFDTQGIRATAPRLVTNIEAGFSGDTPSLDGYVRVENTDVAAPAFGLTLHGLDIRLPFALNATTPPSGRFTTTSVERAGQLLPPLTGELWLTRKAAYLGLDWPILPEGTVKASASIDFLPQKTVADIQAWVPEFDFRSSDAIRKLLPPALADLDVTGKFSAELRYTIDGPTLFQWGEIDVKDATIKSKALDADLTGVSGQVWTRSLSPLETPPGQTLSVKSARLGNLQVANGSVDFRIDPGNLIFVESSSFSLAGGQLTARGFRVDPARNATDLTLYADKLDVGQLAQILAPGKVTGSGRLFARLPVSVQWPQRVTLHDGGYLYASANGPNPQAPEHLTATGSLNLGPYGETIGSWVGVSPGATPSTPSLSPADIRSDVARRVVSALSDFGFSHLALDLTRPSPTDPLSARLKMNGVGTSKTGAQALDLNFNFSGFESAFNLYLGFNNYVDNLGK